MNLIAVSSSSVHIKAAVSLPLVLNLKDAQLSFPTLCFLFCPVNTSMPAVGVRLTGIG